VLPAAGGMVLLPAVVGQPNAKIDEIATASVGSPDAAKQALHAGPLAREFDIRMKGSSMRLKPRTHYYIEPAAPVVIGQSVAVSEEIAIASARSPDASKQVLQAEPLIERVGHMH